MRSRRTARRALRRTAWAAAGGAPGDANARGIPARMRPSATTAATLLRLTTPAGGSARERLEDRPHAVERGPEVGLRVGVGKPQIALAMRAERGARERGHAGLVEQPLGDLRRRTLRAGDVREDVKSTARAQALHAGQLVEPIDEDVAPPLELGDHPPGLLALQRGNAGHVHARRR